jgi:hypothetical protein
MGSTDNNILNFDFVDFNNGWAVADSFDGSNIMPPLKILHTTDAGANWSVQLTDNTPGVSEGIQFVDVNNGWVVGNSGKIYHTTNGGTNWVKVTNAGVSSSTRAQSPFFLNADTGWIVGDNALLHTTNAGQSWSNLSTPYGPTNIYFVDANNGWSTSDNGGMIAHTTSGGEPTLVQENYTLNLPSGFELSQNYPNPFNPSTTISFSLPSKGFVSLKVFDLIGRRVATIISEELPAGNHSRQWNANNLASGIYFYRLQTGSFTETKKLLFLK